MGTIQKTSSYDSESLKLLSRQLHRMQQALDEAVEAIDSEDQEAIWVFHRKKQEDCFNGLATWKLELQDATDKLLAGNPNHAETPRERANSVAKAKEVPRIPGVQAARANPAKASRQQANESGVKSASRKQTTRGKASGSQSATGRKRKRG